MNPLPDKYRMHLEGNLWTLDYCDFGEWCNIFESPERDACISYAWKDHNNGQIDRWGPSLEGL